MLEKDEIYNNIVDGYKYIEKLKINEEIDKPNFKKILSENSEYFPGEIKKYITSNLNQMTTYKVSINSKKVVLNFYTKKTQKNNFKNEINKTFAMIYVLSLYSEKRCSNSLTINIYLTPFKRQLPKNATDILGPINVNGGLTYGGCQQTNEITIYRDEDWFKVLIHELFHAFNLDFSNMKIEHLRKKIITVTGIPSEYLIFETYCETWARILNVAMNSTSKADFDVLIRSEQLFSLIQCNKIIKRIKKLKTPSLYKEESNIICYYVFTGALMNNYEKFIKWCSNNGELLNFNKTLKNVDSFLNHILKEYMDFEFIENLDVVNDIDLGELKNSLRMTLI